MGFILPNPESPKEQARALIARKDEIQTELDEKFAILSAQSSTMNSPLVDKEGFPRADVDVYAVRLARVRIIELQNDMKAIMDDIAKALEVLHSVPEPSSTASIGESTGDAHAEETLNDADLRPFAKVDGVAPGSPAASAGLQREDLLLQFGTLKASDFSASSLQPLAGYVAEHEGQPLQVKVQRTDQLMKFTFTPRKGWGGRGLLGCHIVPYTE